MMYKRYREESEAARMVCTYSLSYTCVVNFVLGQHVVRIKSKRYYVLADRGREGIEAIEKDIGSPCYASSQV